MIECSVEIGGTVLTLILTTPTTISSAMEMPLHSTEEIPVCAVVVLVVYKSLRRGSVGRDGVMSGCDERVL